MSTGFDPDKVPPEMWKRMNITRERFLEIRGVMEEREKLAPALGGAAPDFALRRLSRDRKLSDERLRLSRRAGVGLLHLTPVPHSGGGTGDGSRSGGCSWRCRWSSTR